MRKLLTLCFAVILFVPGLLAQDSKSSAIQSKDASRIELPRPSQSGGMALTEALAHRRSVRSFAATPLTPAEISQLVWAAQGITDDKGRRTAPSARAQYFLHLYVASAEGVFEYIPVGHQLQKLSAQDVRAKLSGQKQVAAAPLVLIVTGEYERATKQTTPEVALRWVNLEAGHATQNVLLQAEALGLGAVPVGGIDPKQIQAAASLPGQNVAIYLIPVGHPN